MLPHELTPIQNELDGKEQLLWSGRPKQGVVFRSADLFLVPFTLMWAGFALFWELGAIGAGIGFFACWGMPFVLMGGYITVGRFIVDAAARRRTDYGLTNERAIIISGLFNREVRSVNLHTTSDISVTQRGNGVGTIMFGPPPPYAGRRRGIHWPGTTQQMVSQFELIPDAKRVYELVRDVQRA